MRTLGAIRFWGEWKELLRGNHPFLRVLPFTPFTPSLPPCPALPSAIPPVIMDTLEKKDFLKVSHFHLSHAGSSGAWGQK